MNPLRWRKMTWAIVIFTGLMFGWMASAGGTEVCNEYPVGSVERQNCEVGEDTGTGIGVVLLGLIWFVGFLILSVIWLMTHGQKRLCPACGKAARDGEALCRKCGYNLVAAAAGQKWDATTSGQSVAAWAGSPAPQPPMTEAQ